MEKINSCTEDKQLFNFLNIDSILNRLGFNICSKGYIYYRDLIKNSSEFNLDEIKLIDLYSLTSKNFNKPEKQIIKNIENLFTRLNLDKFKTNFPAVFKLDFDYIYTTPKNLLILISNLQKLY